MTLAQFKEEAARFRKEFDLTGTPMRIQMKTSSNPFKDKESD